MSVGSVLATESLSLGKNRPGWLFVMTKVAAEAAPETDDGVHDGLHQNDKRIRVKQAFCHDRHAAWKRSGVHHPSRREDARRQPERLQNCYIPARLQPGKAFPFASRIPLRHERNMTLRLRALGVHLFTATGAVFAMLSMLAAVDEKWDLMFLWLVVAFFVDGIDGPLARHYHVKVNAPEFDGVLLDLIIDYLTYVFIPAFALFKSGLMDGWTGWFAIIVITFASALYFADTRMKTKDNSFSGFPGCWNMLVLVIFALQPNFWVSLALVTALAIAMFLPLKFVHPVRTERWRFVTLPTALAWTFFAGWAAWVDFHPQSWAHWGLVATSVYLLFAGIAQQLFPQRDPS